MGQATREDSVLNAHNQIHAVKNVFMTDGACMTSAACVNPSLTYMALTARAADFAVEEMKKLNLLKADGLPPFVPFNSRGSFLHLPRPICRMTRGIPQPSSIHRQLWVSRHGTPPQQAFCPEGAIYSPSQKCRVAQRRMGHRFDQNCRGISGACGAVFQAPR